MDGLPTFNDYQAREITDISNPGDIPLPLADFLGIWRELRGARAMPSRAAFDLPTIKAHLGWVSLVDVEPDGRFRYRLVGSSITAVSKREPTGKYLDELYRPDIARCIVGVCRTIVERRNPFVTRTTVHGREFLYYDALVLPLSDDGATVNKLILRNFIEGIKAERWPLGAR